MFKKIVVGIVISAISAGLIYGAINRTTARSDHSVEERQSQQESHRSGRGDFTSNEGKIWLNVDEKQNGSQVRGRQGTRNAESSPDQVAENTGQIEVKDWISLIGTVNLISDDVVQVQTEDGELITIEGMPRRFAEEQGFLLQEGMRVELMGFFEGDEFEVGEITDLRFGLSISLREASGRPLWAGGRGRRGV